MDKLNSYKGKEKFDYFNEFYLIDCDICIPK